MRISIGGAAESVVKEADLKKNGVPTTLKPFELKTKGTGLLQDLNAPEKAATVSKPAASSTELPKTEVKKAASGLKQPATVTKAASTPAKTVAKAYLTGPNAKLLSTCPGLDGDLTSDPIAIANRDRLLVIGNLAESIKEADAKKAVGYVLPKPKLKLGPVGGKELIFDIVNPAPAKEIKRPETARPGTSMGTDTKTAAARPATAKLNQTLQKSTSVSGLSKIGQSTQQLNSTM